MEFRHKITIIIITSTLYTINLLSLEDSVCINCVKRMFLWTYMYCMLYYLDIIEFVASLDGKKDSSVRYFKTIW